jgi:hypothetical protein
MHGMASGLDVDIFYDIITGDQAGRVFCPMEPPFLGTAQQTYAVLYLSSSQGSQGYVVLSRRFLHRYATIAAIEDSRCCDHRYGLLRDNLS